MVICLPTTPHHTPTARTSPTTAEIYANGKELCENMWNGAFEYVPESDAVAHDLAYTMWFYGDNPNAAISEERLSQGLPPLDPAKVPRAARH